MKLVLPRKKRSLILLVVVAAAGCREAAPSPALPSSAPATATIIVAAPGPTASTTATATPSAAATAAPTATPAASPSPTPLRETVTLLWAPEAPAVDSDDIDEIIADLRRRPGILGGIGSESSITIIYDPTIRTVEEIMAIMDRMGYPVLLP